MAKKKTTKSKTVSFEDSLQSLKQIVAELEAGNLSLSDSLAKYEQGIANLKRCHDALEDTQKKIELLVDLDENGNLITKRFDDSSSASNAVGVRRQTKVKTEQLDDDEFDEIDDQLDDTYGNDDDEDGGLF